MGKGKRHRKLFRNFVPFQGNQGVAEAELTIFAERILI